MTQLTTVVYLQQVHKVKGSHNEHVMTTCTQTLHQSELPFIHHLLLYPRKLRIYSTLNLLHVFLNTLDAHTYQ